MLLGERYCVFCRILNEISYRAAPKRTAKCLACAKGASLVEASVTIVLFVFFTLSLVDLSRYFMARAVLEYAVFQGANLAAKLELEVDTSDENCQEHPEQCEDFKKRLAVISDTVLETANIISSSASSGGGLQRVKFRSYYAGDQKVNALMEAGNLPPESDVAIVRPGEKLLMLLPGNNNKEIDHPTRSYSQGWPAQGENWRKILDDRNPIGVHLGAIFKPITPMMPEMVIHTNHWVMRRPKVFGAPIPKLPSTATPNASASPTTAPAPTETPLQTSTATPLPSDTVPSEIPTATPTNGAPTSTPTAIPAKTFGEPELLLTPIATPTPTSQSAACQFFNAAQACLPTGCCYMAGACGLGSKYCPVSDCDSHCNPQQGATRTPDGFNPVG